MAHKPVFYEHLPSTNPSPSFSLPLFLSPPLSPLSLSLTLSLSIVPMKKACCNSLQNTGQAQQFCYCLHYSYCFCYSRIISMQSKHNHRVLCSRRQMVSYVPIVIPLPGLCHSALFLVLTSQRRCMAFLVQIRVA